MAIAQASMLPLFFFLLFHVHVFMAYAARSSFGEATERQRNHHYHVVAVETFLLPRNVCSHSFTKDVRRSQVPLLPISHRYKPCSPSTSTSLTHFLLQDQSRVLSIHHKISNKGNTGLYDSSQEKLPATSGDSLGTGNYIVTVGLGTPKQDYSLVFDTGSDLTWLQCEPCSSPGSCYSQQQPLLDPSKSSTYSNIPCNSPECSQIRSHDSNTPCSSSSTCTYSVTYGDRSYTKGVLARETLTLSPNNVLPSFLFGCGNNNRGLFGEAAGLLGLGRDPESLVSQSSSKFGQVFSYCLPSSKSSTGYLALGREGSASRNSVAYTPLIKDERGTSFYFVNLVDISVGGQRLSISPSLSESSGTIIDSGTVITRLPPSAYASLRDAFKGLMSRYPSAEGNSLLDTCYDLSGEGSNVELPKIVLHFENGVDVVVDVSGILIGESFSQLCLAFAGNEDETKVGIIGNRQQVTYEVVYDVGGEKIGFGPGGCN
ncbi:hypothetical protein Scep_018009 [Stephania cephalantha]|uniref:Peptidase A1 domain-containing protein n=1 Tax=Stephania cephalantha TaxID=152367 RepID=A0AAP0IQM2_9MAGN